MDKEPERLSQYSELYQLHLDLESIARQLSERNRNGWVPLRKHVDALYEISVRLKVLDKNPNMKFPDLRY